MASILERIQQAVAKLPQQFKKDVGGKFGAIGKAVTPLPAQFGQQIVPKVAQVGKTTADVATRVREAVEKLPQQLKKEVPKLQKTATVAKDIIRDIPRGIARIGISGIQETQKQTTGKYTPFTPKTPVQKFIYGDREVKPYSTQSAEVLTPLLKKAGIDPSGFAGKAALGLGAVGLIGLDVSSPLGGSKVPKELFEKAVTAYGKEAASQIMAKGGKKLLEEALGEGGEQVLKKAGIGITKQADDLAQEARKYKSAEEFVRAQPTLYRGGESFDVAKFDNKHGLSVSKDMGMASKFVKENGMGHPRGKGALHEVFIEPNAKIATINDIPKDILKPRRLGLETQAMDTELVSWARENGFDAIDMKGITATGIHRVEQEIRVLNPDVLKTKSQLTEIYNKEAQILRGTKGMTAQDIMSKHPVKSLDNIIPAVEPKLKTEVSQNIAIKAIKFAKENENSSLLAKGFRDPATKYADDLLKKQLVAKAPKGSTLLTSAINLYKQAKTKLVDSAAPIEDLLASSLKKAKLTLLPQADITSQIDRVFRAPSIAGQFARDNGLEQVIKEADNLNNLDQYLIAKQARKVSERGIETGRDLAKDKELIEAFAPLYERPAQVVTAYSRKLLDYSVESGLISKDLATKLKELYPDYVPLNRVFAELEQYGGQASMRQIASLSRQTVVQRLEGSTREIESPVASLLEKTTDTFVQGERNKAARLLANYEKLPDNPFSIRELAQGESAAHTFSFLDNGVKRTFETTPEIAAAAKSLNVQQLNILGKILAFPVRVAKLGITGINLPFVAANVVRDQIFSIITSQNALKTSLANPSVFVKALFSAVKHDELYEEMIRQGAGSTSFDIARNQIPKTIEKIRASRSMLGRIKYTIRHPGDLVRAVEDIVGRSEELTRIQQFAGTKEALVKKGFAPELAAIEAGKAARENTANFMRKGEWGQVLNSTFLYLNAGIQGSRAFVRALSRNPVSTSAKVATTLFLPVAVTTAWNLNDPERKKAYEDIADYEKENNLIIIPPGATKDEDGKWNIIKIPLPAGVSKIAIPVRKAMEQAYQVDQLTFQDIARGLIGAVSPVEPETGSIISTAVPQAIKPTLEAATNKNFFTGFPQVPQSLEKLSPENQVKDTTSGTARVVGKTLNASPIKVEEFVKGTLGGVGSQILNLTDRVLAGMDIIPKDQIGGQNVIEAISARFTKARGGEVEQKSADEIKTILTKQADESFRRKQEAELLYDELKQLPKDEANTKAKEIKKANPLLYEKLKDVVEDTNLGLSYEDRLMKQLGVENGERAKFIWEAVKQFKTDEEKNAYIKELRRKKIISDEVLKQLKKLKTNTP